MALVQVDRTRAWSHGGSASRSIADWLANCTGTSLGDAIRETNTARNLDGLGATEDALRNGDLSGQQTTTGLRDSHEAYGADALVRMASAVRFGGSRAGGSQFGGE